MLKPAAVTQREAVYLEHRRRAAAQDLPLSEYCRRNGLRVGEWYQVQRGLARKGAVNRTGGEKAQSASFAPVRLTGNAMVSATAMPMGCRIVTGNYEAYRPTRLRHVVASGVGSGRTTPSSVVE
jgi:hypothetical protein